MTYIEPEGASLNRTNRTDEDLPNLHIVEGVAIFSIVYLFVLMIPTVIINTMTLFAIYKDPLKCFRNPLGIFTTGVIVADLIMALIVLPFFAASDAHDLHVGMNDVSFIINHIATEVLVTAVIISFLTLLGLAVSQLIAVKSPMVFDRWVTNRSAKIGLIVIWTYAILFTIVQYCLSDSAIAYFDVWFLVVHVTIVTVTLVIIYIVTYLFFVIRAASQLDEQESKQVTREFFKGTCILSMLQIILVWPVTIAMYVDRSLDTISDEMEVNLWIAHYFCDNIFFVKFLLDPLVLIWRIPKYRRAMKTVYWRAFGLQLDKNAKGKVAYNRANVAKKDDDSMEDIDVEVL